MAKIFSDRDVKKLLQNGIIRGADERCLNPNGIAFRVGEHVRFISTNENKQLIAGKCLRVMPGETVLIASHETIDFRAETVHKHYPNCVLMAWISPITSMMREGIAQVTTKIDAGYSGNLNWSIRNNSNCDLLIPYGQPLYKLTIYLLEGDEKPEKEYGNKEDDFYQGTSGIKPSQRQVPASLCEEDVVSSSLEKLDPQKQLRQAGYPFNHMAAELSGLHGEITNVKTQTKDLADKVGSTTNALTEKMGQVEKTVLDRIRETFRENFIRAIGTIIAAICLTASGVVFLTKNGFDTTQTSLVIAAAGVVVLLITFFLTRK